MMETNQYKETTDKIVVLSFAKESFAFFSDIFQANRLALKTDVINKENRTGRNGRTWNVSKRVDGAAD